MSKNISRRTVMLLKEGFLRETIRNGYGEERMEQVFLLKIAKEFL